jgi:hypothetical protein
VFVSWSDVSIQFFAPDQQRSESFRPSRCTMIYLSHCYVVSIPTFYVMLYVLSKHDAQLYPSPGLSQRVGRAPSVTQRPGRQMSP